MPLNKSGSLPHWCTKLQDGIYCVAQMTWNE